ncbi:MAG: nuclear transport factor 2 family protein [Candidatus Kapaibacterium sp.]
MNESSPARLAAQRQLDAYNARDIDAFAACYTVDVELLTQQGGEVFCRGIDELRERYGRMFAATPGLHCELVSRMVCGDIAIDEEMVRGVHESGVVHAIAIYEVQGDLIRRAWFVREVLPE